MKDKIISETRKKMGQSQESTSHEFNTVRTGRASVALLDNIFIDYYGTRTQVKHAANISVPEPRMILISPFDPKFLKEIETQLIKSDLGINPTNDGKVIRLAVPPLNEERRLELVKLVKKIAEDGKVAMRNIRRDVNDEFKKMESNGDITKDDLAQFQKETQNVTDEFVENINSALQLKEKEIMEV